MKAKAILLNSDFTGEEVDVNIKGGFCVVDLNKDETYEFFVDRTAPIKVKFQKSPFKKGSYDFYLFSWKSLVPLEFDVVEEIVNADEVEKKLEKEGASKKEIKKVINKIRRLEKESGKKIEKFVFRKLEPVKIDKSHWSRTELPSIIRETVEMRFLKALKTYTEGRGGFSVGGGKIVALAFACLFMLFMFLYSLSVAGVFG